jgi:ribosomal peptide maturation radical SAM protein 1
MRRNEETPLNDIPPEPKVLLISMPWAPRNYTPIRLGVLKAALESGGLSCHTENLFLRFAERIDPELYDRIAMSLYFCVGEWLFNVSLFPDSSVEYLDYLADCTMSQAKLLGESDLAVFECISDSIYRDRLIQIRDKIAPNFLADELERLIPKPYDIIGFSCVVNQLIPALALAKMWKERRPETLIVFGGASVQGEMGEECLRAFPWVDVIVDGEGDVTLPELVRFQRSDPNREAWQTSAPHGLFIRVADKIVHTGDRPIISNLDSISVPDYTDYFTTLREMTNAAPSKIFIQFEASRGCWWGQKSNCLFCGLNSNSIVYRPKSPERTLMEMLTLTGKYRMSHLYAVDTICGPTMYKKVLPKISESGYDLSLFLEIHPTLARDHLQVLKEAGVHQIQPGIESFNTEILRLMRKGVDAIRNIRFLKWCRELGIDARYNFLWGFPEELAESYQAMTSLMPSLMHLPPPTYPPCRVLFQRFSPLFTKSIQDYGFVLEPQKDYQYVYPPNVDANRLASSFEHPLPYPSSNGIDYIQPLARIIKEWNNRYYSLRRPMLVYTSGPGFVEVFDTRGEETQEFVLTGLAAAIIVLCSDICLNDTIVHHIRSTWGDEYLHDIKPILDMLVANRLVYREDERYLTLAIPRRMLQEEINFTVQFQPRHR